jgi:hypothetical protein
MNKNYTIYFLPPHPQARASKTSVEWILIKQNILGASAHG